jgi:hypothetical protein
LKQMAQRQQQLLLELLVWWLALVVQQQQLDISRGRCSWGAAATTAAAARWRLVLPRLLGC